MDGLDKQAWGAEERAGRKGHGLREARVCPVEEGAGGRLHTQPHSHSWPLSLGQTLLSEKPALLDYVNPWPPTQFLPSPTRSPGGSPL